MQNIIEKLGSPPTDGSGLKTELAKCCGKCGYKVDKNNWCSVCNKEVEEIKISDICPDCNYAVFKTGKGSVCQRCLKYT